MKWRPEYATGLASIDEQHKTLFASTDSFREALNAGEGAGVYDLFLQFLSAYAEAHFGLEDECMHIRKCPVAARNKVEHAAFLTLLDREAIRYRSAGFSPETAGALLDKVEGWLTSHICRIDIQLRDHAPG
ncbi:bacteriohemerythrin [Solirhodobacter olei]|uniref:bacteriohemerythrin n=1 Tax=Solirhodobacter olei TaxID=2493082 RepID=UPI000FD80CBC|nr:hemerythrin domain-containing protein [Solirhodobacter olei]